MKKKHKLQEGEALYHWCNRLAEAYGFTPEQKEVLHEVRMQSYIVGSRAAMEIIEKYKK